LLQVAVLERRLVRLSRLTIPLTRSLCGAPSPEEEERKANSNFNSCNQLVLIRNPKLEKRIGILILSALALARLRYRTPFSRNEPPLFSCSHPLTFHHRSQRPNQGNLQIPQRRRTNASERLSLLTCEDDRPKKMGK